MMIFDETLLQPALWLTNALLIGMAGLLIVRLRKDVRLLKTALAERAPATPVAAPDDDVRRLFDRHLAVLEHYLTAAEQGSGDNSANVGGEAIPAAQTTSTDPAELARQGASVDDLVNICGLNRGEAQLLMRLHGGSARPATH